MIDRKGVLLASFLVASTSPMAFGQTSTQTETQTDTGTGATTSAETDTTTSTGTDTTTDTGTDATTGTDTTTDTGTGVGTATGTTTGTGTDATADVTGEDAENRRLITLLTTVETGDKDWEAEFQNLSADAQVRIVKLSDLKDTDVTLASQLDQSISDMEDSRDEMRSAIEAHAAMTSALQEEDYEADDVVAAMVEPGTDDAVTLVVDDESDD